MRPFILAALCLANPAVAALTSAETLMVNAVDAEHAASIALLERLVNQNSGTLNLVGVEAVGRMMRAELEPLGFTVQWKPMASTKRAGHLIATRKGSAGTKRLLLIGHLDTVFELSSPFQRFVRKGDKAEGPGAGDDKGGMVVMLSALKAMQAAGALEGANIEIVLTGDEEDAGEPIAASRADLIAAGRRADAALDFEGLSIEGGRDMGVVARRSSSSWTLQASGRTGHSSGVFSADAGNGAIYELTRIIARFRDELPEPNLTFNVGLIAGGVSAATGPDGTTATAAGKTNIIPAAAVARGDLRTLTAEQDTRVRAKMQGIVAQHLPGSAARLSFDVASYPPMAPTAGNRALLASLNAVNADLGLPPQGELDPIKRGAGDISFVAADVDGLVGLGAASTGDHAPGETVDLESMRRQAKRAAILMARLGREPRP